MDRLNNIKETEDTISNLEYRIEEIIQNIVWRYKTWKIMRLWHTDNKIRWCSTFLLWVSGQSRENDTKTILEKTIAKSSFE